MINIRLFNKQAPVRRKPRDCLRIVSFNVHFAKHPEKIAAAILKNRNLNQADIFLLQEVEAHLYEDQERVKVLAKYLEMEAQYEPARYNYSHSHGLAVLSRFPFQATVRPLNLAKFSMYFHSRDRIAMKTKVSLGGKTCYIYNLHLDTLLNIEDRLKQLKKVIKDINRTPKDCVILAGDLNTVPFRWFKNGVPISFSNQKKQLREFLFEEGFDGLPLKLGYTSRQVILRLQLDGIFSKGFRVKNYGVEKTIRVSDHCPVWADLELSREEIIDDLAKKEIRK